MITIIIDIDTLGDGGECWLNTVHLVEQCSRLDSHFNLCLANLSTPLSKTHTHLGSCGPLPCGKDDRYKSSCHTYWLVSHRYMLINDQVGVLFMPLSEVRPYSIITNNNINKLIINNSRFLTQLLLLTRCL